MVQNFMYSVKNRMVLFATDRENMKLHVMLVAHVNRFILYIFLGKNTFPASQITETHRCCIRQQDELKKEKKLKKKKCRLRDCTAA